MNDSKVFCMVFIRIKLLFGFKCFFLIVGLFEDFCESGENGFKVV